MAYKYLNDLSFEWKLSYSDPTVGYWWFSANDHPHPQWVTITIQSNPQWFTVWGIQQLLNQWKVQIAGHFGSPNNVFSGLDDAKALRLYNHGLDTEILRDQEHVRLALDMMIYHTRADIYNHIIEGSWAEGAHIEEAVIDADYVTKCFSEAFS